MFRLHSKTALPAQVSGAAQPWTEQLFNSTFAKWGDRMTANVHLHSMTICKEYGEASGKFPARLYKAKFALQGAGGRGQVFFSFEVLDPLPGTTGPGSVAFTYLYNVATGQCDIPQVAVQLNDGQQLETALRQAFAAAAGRRPVDFRLAVKDLTWEAVKDRIEGGNACFDIAYFSLWEQWGTPIDPHMD